MTASIPKVESLASTPPPQILVSHVNTKPRMKFIEASAYALMWILRNEIQEERAVRNIIEGLFGNGQYARLKKNTFGAFLSWLTSAEPVVCYALASGYHPILEQNKRAKLCLTLLSWLRRLDSNQRPGD